MQYWARIERTKDKIGEVKPVKLPECCEVCAAWNPDSFEKYVGKCTYGLFANMRTDSRFRCRAFLAKEQS